MSEARDFYDGHGYVAFVEVEKSILDQTVPDNFPHASGQTFRDMCISKENASNALLTVGWRDENGNREYPVYLGEFAIWADHFGLENLLTLAQARALIENNYINNLE